MEIEEPTMLFKIKSNQPTTSSFSNSINLDIVTMVKISLPFFYFHLLFGYTYIVEIS